MSKGRLPSRFATEPDSRVESSGGPWPFTTWMRLTRPGGEILEWTSRAHRKARSLFRGGSHDSGDSHDGVWWAPHRLAWWIGVLFAIGSICFIVGPLPAVAATNALASAWILVIGALFFAAAAYLTTLECANADPVASGGTVARVKAWAYQPRSIDWWATMVQFVGTIAFIVTTNAALLTLPPTAAEKLIWAPDAIGSLFFLISSVLAFAEAGGRWVSWRVKELGWQIAAWNLLGSVFFGVAAVGAFIVPATDFVWDETAMNAGTVLGAVCFLIGALELLPEAFREQLREDVRVGASASRT